MTTILNSTALENSAECKKKKRKEKSYSQFCPLWRDGLLTQYQHICSECKLQSQHDFLHFRVTFLLLVDLSLTLSN